MKTFKRILLFAVILIPIFLLVGLFIFGFQYYPLDLTLNIFRFLGFLMILIIGRLIWDCLHNIWNYVKYKIR